MIKKASHPWSQSYLAMPELEIYRSLNNIVPFNVVSLQNIDGKGKKKKKKKKVPAGPLRVGTLSPCLHGFSLGTPVAPTSQQHTREVNRPVYIILV